MKFRSHLLTPFSLMNDRSRDFNDFLFLLLAITYFPNIFLQMDFSISIVSALWVVYSPL